MMEAKYRSAAIESEGDVKLQQRDSYTLRDELSTTRKMNSH